MANTKIPIELSSTPSIVDNGDATAITIDSSEKVGLGCTPHFPFDVQLNSSRRIGFNYSDSQNTILSHDGSGNIETLGLRGNTLVFYSDYDASNPDGVERMKIDAAGIITKPYQPAFDVDYNGNASIADGNYLVYPNVRLNIGSHYSTSTGKFTAPVAGNYLIYWDAIGGNDADVYRFKLHKNDAQYLQHTQLRIDTPLNQYGNGTKVMIVPLAASDTLRIYYDSDAGNTSYANDNYLTFGGHLIG